ncbi:basic-leucine zipper domain protein [Nannochloropsis oceanica]
MPPTAAHRPQRSEAQCGTDMSSSNNSSGGGGSQQQKGNNITEVEQEHCQDDEAEDGDGEGEGEEEGMDDETKRQKRLELNRKAAHESRKRKKAKYQQLVETLQTLRTDTLQLSAQNDLMRQQLATPQATKYTPEKEELEKENKQLRNALLMALQALGEDEEDGEGERQPPALQKVKET